MRLAVTRVAAFHAGLRLDSAIKLRDISKAQMNQFALDLVDALLYFRLNTTIPFSSDFLKLFARKH